MRQAILANEFLEVLSDELRAIVADDSRLHARVLFSSSCNHQLDVLFCHRLAKFLMNDVATETIEYGYQEVERAANVDVADVHMPFLVDFRWLNEACAFLAGSNDLAIQTTIGILLGSGYVSLPKSSLDRVEFDLG